MNGNIWLLLGVSAVLLVVGVFWGSMALTVVGGIITLAAAFKIMDGDK